mmetsp:Transcript_5868/g.533  ORF Transcript_5868/g.533 Transcript_5868/m.533 type:complete len:97 (-) Transcript_5868:24-314(-)
MIIIIIFKIIINIHFLFFHLFFYVQFIYFKFNLEVLHFPLLIHLDVALIFLVFLVILLFFFYFLHLFHCNIIDRFLLLIFLLRNLIKVYHVLVLID